MQAKGENTINTTYVYRKHLRQPRKIFLAGVGVFIVFVILLSAGLLLTESEPLDLGFVGVFAAVMFFVAVLITLELLLINAVFLRRFKYISVTLEEQGIIYTNSKEQIFIPYEDISRIQFPSIKYAGGWVKIVYGNGNENIRLTVVLENIGDFMSKLKQKLDERNKMDVYNEKKYFSFYKTGVFADESWDRVYGNIGSLTVTCLTCVVITIVALFSQKGFEYNKILIYASFLVPIIGYAIAEILIGFQVHKRVVTEFYQLLPRNKEFENKAFMIGNFGMASIYLIILILINVAVY